ncbi:MAG: alpha/beta hydrolase family protein [Qipengyuania sp.]
MKFITFLAAAATLAAQPLLAQEADENSAASRASAGEDVFTGHPEIANIGPDGRPGLIPTRAFASRGQLGTAKLSPDGGKFAYIHRARGDTHLVITDAATLEQLRAIKIPDGNSLRWFRWANGERLLISLSGRTLFGFFPVAYTRLSLFDLADQEFRSISLEKQGLEGDDVLYMDPAGRYILLSASRKEFDGPDVWRFPLDKTGAEGAVLVQKRKGNVDEWWADNAGVVRLGMGWTGGGATIIHYRSAPDEEFRRVTKLKRDADELDNWDVMGIYAGSDLGYAMTKEDNGRIALRRFDYSKGEAGDLVYANSGWDVDAVRYDIQQQPVAVRYIDDFERTVWLDDALASTQKALEQALGGGRVDIISHVAGKRMLVLHSGSSDPGALYVYSPAEKRLDLFANLRPEVDFRLLTEGAGHTIAARDGTEMRAYLTLPRGREAKGLPLIIMPHGGPYGVRDTLSYGDWVQVLANRGYAVLQPNYRGSGGYGEAFEELGDGQIGRKMQDDLDDAVRWAVERGTADPARVCIVGGSYGGYAALWGAIRNPETYRCAASFAGVTDWERQLDYSTDFLARRYRKDWRRKVRGENFDMKSVAPVHQVARLARPVLLAHGKRDIVVPFKQYEELVQAADKASVPIEKLELDDDHHLSKAENERAWFDALLAFLDKHNPAD